MNAPAGGVKEKLMKKLIILAVLLFFQNFAIADCNSALYKETGLMLTEIKKNNISIGEEAALKSFPVGDGGIYAYKKSVGFMGESSLLTMGMYMSGKASSVSLGFSKEVDHISFSEKYNLEIKSVTQEAILFSCEDGISLGFQKLNDMHAIILKSIAEVDILTAINL